MRKNGFTIFELLVVIIISLTILGGAFTTYTKFLREFKGESESEESFLEKVVGSELIRLDLEHIGFGLSKNETVLPIDWNINTKILTIYSSLNNTNKKTYGFVFVDCSSGNWPSGFGPGDCNEEDIACDKRADTSNNYLIYINSVTKDYVATGTFGTCPGTGVYIGIPYDSSVNNACNNGYCYKISYALSQNQTYSHCHPNTKNLTRSINDQLPQPLVYCVSDFVIKFDLDTDGDGVIDTTADKPSNEATVTPAGIKSQLKQIKVYLLVQEGGLDKDYRFQGNTNIDGITLQLPQNYLHYRWKVYKLVVKPMNLGG